MRLVRLCVRPLPLLPPLPPLLFLPLRLPSIDRWARVDTLREP